MKYLKKPLEVSAVQWTGNNFAELQEFAQGYRLVRLNHDELELTTFCGCHQVAPGDWLICGVNSEVYPCPKDVFAKSYLPSYTSDQDMQADFEQSGSVFPKVTAEEIEHLMATVQYDVHVVPGTTTTLVTAMLPMGSTMFTLASEVMACVDARNFNAEKGAKYGIEKAANAARNKLWEVEGYALAKKINAC